jgi:hypothetical protein
VNQTSETRIEVSVDTELAACYQESFSISERIASAENSIHWIANSQYHYIRRTKVYTTTIDEAIAKIEATVVTSERIHPNIRTALETIARRAELIETKAQIEAVERELNEIYEAFGRWSRFFVVPGGHIHSSMDCHSCYPTTRFGWLPELSGLTEAEAVAEHGTILCSFCYPSAPVEWTLSKEGEKPADYYCEGSGQAPKDGVVNHKGYRGAWGHCPVCGKDQTVTSEGWGVIRKHQTPKKKGA